MIRTQIFSSKAIAWICILAVIMGSITITIFGMYNLVKIGLLTLGIPVILASLLAIWKPHLFEEFNYNNYKELTNLRISFLNLTLFYILLYLISLYILIASLTRTFSYFLIISLMASIIFLGSVSLNSKQETRKNIILIEIILLFANLTQGHTLKAPMITFTDAFYHMNIIEKIVNSGHVTSEIGTYQYFPLFHILNCIGLLLTNLSIKFSYFILNDSLFLVSILLVYLIAHNSTKNSSLSLVTVLVYTFSRPVIDSGMYVVTRTMAYILCLLILYLLLLNKKDIRVRTLSIFLIIPLILTHQTTLVIFTGILLLIIIIQKVLNYSTLINLNYLILFLAAYLSYWIYQAGPFFTDVIAKLDSAHGMVTVNQEVEAISSVSYLLNNLDYFLIVFLTILGVVTLLNRYRKLNNIYHVFAIVSFLTFSLYVPGISNLFTPILGNRFPILVAPFISIAVSVGAVALVKQYDKKYIYQKSSLTLVMFLLFSFFLLSSSLSERSTNYNMLLDPLSEKNRDYFVDSELSSFKYVNQYKNDSSLVYSDFIAYRYLAGYMNLQSSCSVEFFNKSLSKPNSYFVFRKEDYKSSKKLSFFSGYSDVGGFNWMLNIWKLDKNPSPDINWLNGMKIYNSETTFVYKKTV
jgi:uncharacterized membrane protein